MVDVVIREPESGDVAALAAGLCKSDRDEVEAMNGTLDLSHVIARAVNASWPHVWTVMINKEIACIFGVAPVSLLNGIGSPWLLSTELLHRHGGTLVRRQSRYLSIMRKLYPTLVNYVDARNTRSIRWLKRLGFSFHPPRPAGVGGLPFHRFEMGA